MTRSISETAPPSWLAAASGSRAAMPCRVRPSANRRWMTVSCRSRAMRSRSSYTAERRTRSCSRAFSMAMPAACERASTNATSSLVNSGPPDLVRQVEVPVDLVAHLDRHAEERPHGRVVRREAEALGMAADVRDAQLLRVCDQQSQDATARRAGTDVRLLLGGEPDRDELREGLLVLGQHAQCAVARAGHGTGLLDDVAQDLWQFEVGLDEQGGLEDPPELGRILNRTERHRRQLTQVESAALP